MTIRVITPPVIEPVSLAEAKAQCRVDIDDDDALITAYIAAARAWCEAHDWRAYLTQTIELWLDGWPSDDVIEIPRPPLQSVSEIAYYDTDEVKHVLSNTVYAVDVASTPGRARLKYNQFWPDTPLRAHSAISVTYVAGWTAAASVPATIRQAILLLVGHWYENREGSIVGSVSRSIEFGVQALLDVNRAMRY